MKSLFERFTSHAFHPKSAVAEKSAPVQTWEEINSLPFWEGLPSLGADQDVLIERIKECHPILWNNANPYYIRRALYKAILNFRTVCKTQWLYDIKDVKFEREVRVLN